MMLKVSVVRQLIDDELTDLYLLRATYKGQHNVNIITERIEAKIECLNNLLKKIQ